MTNCTRFCPSNKKSGPCKMPHLLVNMLIAVPYGTPSIQEVLQTVANEMSRKYDMSISLAFHRPAEGTLAAAAGYTDAGLGLGVPSRKALPEDTYTWGSTTKMYTASAIFQLIERGIVRPSDPIATHIDPILRALNSSTLVDHFGSAIEAVTIDHLLHMTSGIGDYDASAYTNAQFEDRTHDFGPVEILIGYVPKDLEFTPGTKQRYCSVGRMRLELFSVQPTTATDQQDPRPIPSFPQPSDQLHSARSRAGTACPQTRFHVGVAVVQPDSGGHGTAPQAVAVCDGGHVQAPHAGTWFP